MVHRSVQRSPPRPPISENNHDTIGRCLVQLKYRLSFVVFGDEDNINILHLVKIILVLGPSQCFHAQQKYVKQEIVKAGPSSHLPFVSMSPQCK